MANTVNQLATVGNLLSFAFEAHEVRVIDEQGDSWFVLCDLLDSMETKTTVTAAVESINQGLGDGFVAGIPVHDARGQLRDTIIVAEAAATYLLSRSNTEQGRKLNRFVHVEVLPQIRRTGAYLPNMPDFDDPVAAARAWANEREAARTAEAAHRAAHRAALQRLETEQPYIELAHALTGATTMTRRDWLTMMKEENETDLKERALTQWLIESGYCYRDQASKELRAYAHHSHLFKLEYEMINGGYRPLLKVTGRGVLELTPRVVAAFSGAGQ